ncbi:unnamed protein product [Cochlearia groenlandica]
MHKEKNGSLHKIYEGPISSQDQRGDKDLRKLRIDKQVVEVPCFNTLFKLWWLMDDVVFFLASLKPSGKEYQARHLVRLATIAWSSSSSRGEDVEVASRVGFSKLLFLDHRVSFPC